MSGTRHPALPEGWRELRSSSGMVYYKNDQGATSWDRPSAPVSSRVDNLASSAVRQHPIQTPNLPNPAPSRSAKSGTATASAIPQQNGSYPKVNPHHPFHNKFSQRASADAHPSFKNGNTRHHSEAVGKPIEQANAMHEQIIGLDFGTTFSSCCVYARESDNAPFRESNMYQFNQWLGQRSVNNLPTQLLYRKSEVFRWGDDCQEAEVYASNDTALAKWFKLHLKSSSDLLTGSYAEGLQISRASYPLPAGKTAVEVVADYLRRLRLSMLQNLRTQKYGLKGNLLTYVLTVPAIWNHKEKMQMRQAAVLAGFLDLDEGIAKSQLNFVTEPEAAAFGVWSAAQMHDPAIGETFMICDAGGGTIDLITYIVKNKSPIVFEELVGPSGGLCGSSYLDTQFEKKLRNRFGPYADTLFGEGPKRTIPQQLFLSRFTSYFNAYKQTFSFGSDRRDFICTVDPLGREVYFKNLGIPDGNLFISAEEIANDIFDPVITQIKALISDQLDRAALIGHSSIDFLYVVGGFGSSPYLVGALEEMFSSSRMRVLAVPDSQLTISRGAVMSRLANYNSGPLGPLAGRRLTHSFAHEYDSTSVDSIDTTGRILGENLAGLPIVTGCLGYLAIKGNLYSEDEIFQTNEEFRYLLEEPEHTSWQWERSKQLFSCSTYDRPSWKNQPGKGLLRTFCYLTLSSADIPKAQLEFTTVAGASIGRVVFKIRMKIADHDLTFSLIFRDGVEVSITEALYMQDGGLEAE